MDRAQTIDKTIMVAEDIPGYDYGAASAAHSPITIKELEQLKQSAGFTNEDERWLRIAGEVLTGRTKALVEKWRSVISAHPHLAQYSQTPDGQKDPRYGEASGLRFEQWVLDTCLRPYDQDWLNYQQEIALRHTSVKKNKVDHVQSAPTIKLRDVVAFTAVINDPIIMKPFLAAKGHSAAEVEKMYQAWCKSLLLQVALWTEPYTNTTLAPNEW
jgi:protoglobin